MVRIEGKTIQVTKGDTLRFIIRLSGRDLAQGTQARFTVKKRPWARQPIEIRKELPVVESAVHVLLTAEETNALQPGAYVWDVRITEPTEDGNLSFTPMEYARFDVLAEMDDE